MKSLLLLSSHGHKGVGWALPTGMPMKSPASLLSHRHNRKRESGFTLIEMAIVLVIVGIVISIMATVLPSLIQSGKIRKARAILEKVDYALEGYIAANGQCPCPDTNEDGKENRNDNGTSDDYSDDTCEGDVYVGDLPYLTLGLSSGEDNWHNPIKYAVYEDLIKTTSSTGSNYYCFKLRDIINYYRTNPADTNKLHTSVGSDNTNQVYVVVSGGPKDLDGTGGFFDGYNGSSPDLQFESPNKIVDKDYDDLVRAVSFNYLRGRECGGAGGGGGGSGTLENSYPDGCTNGIDDDGDLMVDCNDPDCFGHPACLAGGENVKIATTSVDSGAVNSDYSATTFTASGGIAPYEWELINKGGFDDFYLHPYTGHLSGTLTQCPGNYSIEVKVTDSTQPTATSDEKDFSIKVEKNLSISCESGCGQASCDDGIQICYEAGDTDKEVKFKVHGGHIGQITWTVNFGEALGFYYEESGEGNEIYTIKRNDWTYAGQFTWHVTAKDTACNSSNSAEDNFVVQVKYDLPLPYTADLVAEWRLDECGWDGTPDEVIDSGKDGFHGTGMNGATTIGSGKLCRAGFFDGNGYVSVDSTTELKRTEAFSLALWVKVHSNASDWVRLAGKGNSTNRNYGLWLATNGTILFQIYSDVGHGNAQTSVTINDGNWHHVVGVYDKSTMKVYIDNIERKSIDYSQDPRTSDDSFTMGYAGFHTYLKGCLDEVMLLHKALPATSETETSVDDIYKLTRSSCSDPFGGDCYAGPIAEYRMELDYPWIGSDQEVKDSSGNNYHGKAVKAAGHDFPSQTTPSGGKVCRAAQFLQGNQGYLALPIKRSDIDIATDETTFMAWVKFEGLASDGYSTIFGTSGGDSPSFFVGKNSGNANIGIQDGTWHSNMGADINPGQWQHIVYRKTGTVKELFVDGEQSPTTANTGTITPALIAIGYENQDGGFYWNGLIDEVRIYDRALAENEIKADKDETRDCAADTVVITSNALTPATIAQNNYAFAPQATGGDTPYGWKLVSSDIPGLKMPDTTTGILCTGSGCDPDQGTIIDKCAGTYYVTIRVTDASSRMDERTLPIEVKNGTLSVTPAPTTLTCNSSTFYQDFTVIGPHRGDMVNWQIHWHGTNPGGFEIIRTSGNTARFRKSGESQTITTQFNLTAEDEACNTGGETPNNLTTGFYTLVISGDGADEPYYSGMIGEWHMDECTWDGATDEVRDSSGTGAHGESHNMGSADTVNRSIGKICYSAAVNIDAVTNQYVTFGHEAFQNLDDFSLSMWFRIDKLSSTGNSLFSGANSSHDNAMLAYLNSAGTSLGTYVNGPNTGTFNLTSVLPDGVADGLWHHLVWTRSGGTEIVYLDTNSISDSNGTINTDPVTLDPGIAIIGQEQDSVGGGFDVNQVFHGWIDEVMVYNKVLLQNDVNKLYTLTHDCVGDCYEGPIAEYRMDEDSWTIDTSCVGDSIGSYTGTVRGSAAIKTDDPDDPGDTHLCNCGQFSNNDSYIDIGGLLVSITDGKKTTVCFWMKWAGNGNEMPIGWGSSYDLFFYGTTRFGFNTGASDLYGIDGADVLAGDWHHVAAVFNNNAPLKNQLYIDGILQPIAVLTGTPVNRTVNPAFYISGWDTGTGYKYDGLIDELRIYTRGLSASEVIKDKSLTHGCPGGP